MATAVDILSYHFDEARLGTQSGETLLTPANVASGGFHKNFELGVDGSVYAQPLYVARLLMNAATRNVLYVATEHDTVYAFDADGGSTEPLWRSSLLGEGETPVPAQDVLTNDIAPEIGITGTPTIDRGLGVLYVVAKSKSADGTAWFQRLHALDLVDGSERLNGPTAIAASVSGSADDAVDGRVAFDPLRQNQRSGLTLADGMVWIAWASHGDNGPYHGWLLGYDATDLAKAPVAWNSTPNASAGGIWMAAGAPSVDRDGNIYLAAGNGSFDADQGGRDYGSSAVKLRYDSEGGLAVLDWFAPSNQATLSGSDLDFGTTTPLLLPRRMMGSKLPFVLAAEKDGRMFVLNRSVMGRYDDDDRGAVQAFTATTGLLVGNPAFFETTLYVCGLGGPLSAYKFDSTTQLLETTPTSRSDCSNCYGFGATPSVSSNGAADAIVWTIDYGAFGFGGPAVLRAYDAADLSKELYDSSSAADDRDQAGAAVKFVNPVIDNGHVYVAGQSSVSVYGLSL
jgi:hypothetical protein